MSLVRLTRFVPTLVLGLSLAAAPLALPLDGPGDQAAFAKNGGNGGGKGGGNGGGKSGGNGGGKGASNGSKDGSRGSANGAGNGGGTGSAAGESGADDALSATDDRPGKRLGQVGKEARELASAPDTTGDIHPSELGRLNGFMNASPNALANAAPNSAIGVVAQSYREALSDYAAETGDDPASIDPALDAAARSLALAANKEVTPEVVAAVNARLAETYPDDPALAGLADPASPESREVAEAIAALTEGYQAEETNQGLGSGVADSENDGNLDDGTDEDVTVVDDGGETPVIQ